MLKIKSLVWINGLFLIVLWMFLFFLPEEVFRIVVIVLGVETLLSGGIWAVISWNQKDYQYRGLLFFWALFEVVFWLLLLIFPWFSEWIVKVLVIILGVLIFIKGIFTIFDGLKAKEMQIGSWWVLLIMGSAGVLFGLFLVTNAFFSFLLLNSLLGFTLILFWIWLIMWGFQIKNVEKLSWA